MKKTRPVNQILQILINGKKTLPIVYALEKKEKFYNLSKSTRIEEDKLIDFVQCLEEDGAKEFTENLAMKFTNEATTSLDAVNWVNKDPHQALKELTNNLLVRNY